MYGLGYLDSNLRTVPPWTDKAGVIRHREPDWPVRRSLVYQQHRQSLASGKSYSLFILASAQDHVEHCMVDFFQRAGSEVWAKDPYSVHIILHDHCLSNWPTQIDRIARRLRENVCLPLAQNSTDACAVYQADCTRACKR